MQTLCRTGPSRGAIGAMSGGGLLARRYGERVVWSGALLLVCFLRTGGQALRIWIALAADRRSPVRYQISAWVYAATPSMCSSVQPRSSGYGFAPGSALDPEAFAMRNAQRSWPNRPLCDDGGYRIVPCDSSGGN